MNLKIIHIRKWVAVLATACVLLSTVFTLAFAQAVTSNCPASDVPVTKNLTLNSDCTYTSQDGILIGKGGITLNCRGHSVTQVNPTGGYGIRIESGLSGVTIENCKESDFFYGFFVLSSPNTVLKGNTATGNTQGFTVEYSPSTTISGNTATDNTGTYGYGFNIFACFSCQISGNTATGSVGSRGSVPATVPVGVGFMLVVDVGSTISNNIATSSTATTSNSGYGFYLTGFVYSSSYILPWFPNTQYTVSGNKADNNQYGYYDVSIGTDNLGLGNTYTGNECSGNGLYGSYDGQANFGPAGLCTPQG